MLKKSQSAGWISFKFRASISCDVHVWVESTWHKGLQVFCQLLESDSRGQGLGVKWDHRTCNRLVILGPIAKPQVESMITVTTSLHVIILLYTCMKGV